MIRKRKESEHMSSLFRKKDINDLVKHASPLKRTLKTWDLTFLGIGAIIGTGIFVLTGKGPNSWACLGFIIFYGGYMLWLCWIMLC